VYTGSSIAAFGFGVFSNDPVESAAEAGLRYVKDAGPCIRRSRHGKSFRYMGADGRTLRDPKHLQRILSLAIPPAWRDVWICPSQNGHLQAVGWDAKGRKQYRYHPRYRSVRDQAKFSTMIAFGTVRCTSGKVRSETLNGADCPRKR
jgi:DNA topoisomerase-1